MPDDDVLQSVRNNPLSRRAIQTAIGGKYSEKDVVEAITYGLKNNGRYCDTAAKKDDPYGRRQFMNLKETHESRLTVLEEQGLDAYMENIP